jgi:hypothetical protein
MLFKRAISNAGVGRWGGTAGRVGVSAGDDLSQSAEVLRLDCISSSLSVLKLGT